jgi:DNA-binding beta-propeller fold protein YncE
MLSSAAIPAIVGSRKPRDRTSCWQRKPVTLRLRATRPARPVPIGLGLLLVVVLLGTGGAALHNPDRNDTDGDRIGEAREPGPLAIESSNRLPTRLAQGPDERFYVSDAQAGSVFIYNRDFTLVGELKNLDRPLGVAVDATGTIYVGNDGRDNVEVYSATGTKLFAIGQGTLQMPNDLAIDRDGNLYAVDSQKHTVWVFDAAGNWVRNIGSAGDGDGELNFPVALVVDHRSGMGELYVADQGNARVQVFDLEGRFLRAYGAKPEAFSDEWEGMFVKIQSLALDAQGRLHAADCSLNKIQILDPDTGAYLESYGTFGTARGQLNLPLDIWITPRGEVVVANAGNHRVEMVHVVSEP